MGVSSSRRPLALAAGLTLVVAVGAALWGWPRTASAPGAAPPPPAEGFAPIPRIDVHVHFALRTLGQAVDIMDAHGVRVALNASGGAPGQGLEESAAAAARTGGRVRPYCNVGFEGVEAPDFGERARAHLARCKALGAVGLKIFKGLGLGVTLADGTLLAVDDPRLDPLFEAAGELGLPVLIHSGDPQAFFRPPTADNERYEELSAHPSWSFHGVGPHGLPWPSWEEVFAQYERRVARHPGTTFVGAHFGNAPEEPARVGRMLDRYPNLVVETGARVPELGRHPAPDLRRLFERHADRILFGTDLAVTPGGLTLGSRGAEPDPPERVAEFFDAHFRFFETRGRAMAHPTPIQGAWTIDGLGLGRPVLERLYYRNAARVFGIDLGPLGGAPEAGAGSGSP